MFDKHKQSITLCNKKYELCQGYYSKCTPDVCPYCNLEEPFDPPEDFMCVDMLKIGITFVMLRDFLFLMQYFSDLEELS